MRLFFFLDDAFNYDELCNDEEHYTRKIFPIMEKIRRSGKKLMIIHSESMVFLKKSWQIEEKAIRKVAHLNSCSKLSAFLSR